MMGKRALKRCRDQIFPLKKKGEKEQNIVYVGFINLEEYDKVNKEALWQVLVVN